MSDFRPSIPVPWNHSMMLVKHGDKVWLLTDLAKERKMESDWLYTVILCGAAIRGIRYDFVKPAVRKAVRA